MRTLHLYLTRQILATLGMTVFVFTFVLLLGNVIKEILDLVVRRQATLGLAMHAIALLIPYVLAFSLPMGMLTAALLVFGRFSADHELTAARASGISLVSLITPILLVSLAVSALCAWLNFDIAPSSRMAYKALLFNAGIKRPGGILIANQDMVFGDNTIFVGNIHNDHTNLDNVQVWQRNEKSELIKLAQSRTGDIAPDLEHDQILLTLHDPYAATRDPASGWQDNAPANGGDIVLPIKIAAQQRQTLSVPISDMTFGQLREKLAELEAATARPLPRKLSAAEAQPMQRQLRQASGDITMPVLVYLNREVSFSFACVGFTLIGIPLGIRAHRRETSVGVATALILVLIYYGFVVLGQAWENHAERAPHLIVWLPNFIFQAAGAVLLWRGNRGV